MNPVAFKFGSITIYWYSLFILIGFSLGFLFAKLEIKRHKSISNTFLLDYFFYLVPIVIVGARIYYCIFEWGYYSKNLVEIIEVWNGGLAIHGGVIAGIIYTVLYTKKHNINPFRFMDIAAPSLALGQALGRWGNFFNQEAYGPIVSLDKLKGLHIPEFIIDGMNINNEYHHPTFLYESITCFLIFIIIVLLRKYYKNLKVGTCCGIYFIIYGIERFLVESLRQDSLMLGSIRIAQLVSIIMLICGIIFVIFSLLKKVDYIEKEARIEKNRKKVKNV